MITSYQRYSDAVQEDRCAPRVKTSIPARVRPAGSHGFNTIVSDLSISGFCCAAVTGAGKGTRCWLTLPGLGSQQAEIIWNNGHAIGCAFATLLNPAVYESVVAKFR